MKKKLMVYLAACLLLIVSACGSRQLDALNPLETAVEVADLAEVAEVAALVPLEEGEGSVLTYPSKMLLLPDGTMVVKDSGGKVLAFSPEGRFVCRVGAKGRGPGEFTSVQDICYDDRNRTVCILDRGKILRYHAADGSFAGEVEIPRHNYDEFAPDGQGGFYLFAAAPDSDSYDFTATFNTVSRIPAEGGQPTESFIPRKDYIMNTSLISRAWDGGYYLRPLEGEGVLYRLDKKISPVLRVDFGSKAMPQHYMINNGMPDFARYMMSDYFKNLLYVHDTGTMWYFQAIGPRAVGYHFVFAKSTEKGVMWKEVNDGDTPSIVMASDKDSFYVMVFTPVQCLGMDPARLSPVNRLVVSALKETGFSLNNNPLIAKIHFII